MDNRNMLQLCRLCLVKDDVNIPIFEEHGDIRQIFLKISSCLPVKVSREDKLPKKICDGCSFKLDTLYEFCNTSANAEKQLLTWLGEAGMNSQMVDGTISAVTQQIKPTDTFVKQETIEPPDIHNEDNDDDKDYMFQQKFEESASAGPSATVTSNEEEEPPPPKRARRTAAVKAAIAMDHDSDDDDDSGEPMTKVEDESEESEGDDQEPSFADAPSTSADDQPGPSGVGKDGVEAPLDATKTKKLINRNRVKVVREKENKIQNMFELREPIQCTLCKQKFEHTLDFAFHSRYHNIEGKYSCHFCDKKIYKRDHFKRHILSHNAYQCELCNKIFKRKSTALNHRHRWEKLYQCNVCGKNLGSSWSLNTHLESVHRESENGEVLPKFQCSICRKHYLYESGLRLHYSSQHKELGIDYSVICDICGRRLSCKSKLKQHLRTHTGDKPYSCKICSRNFTTKDLVTSHMRVHTGEKPYVCMYCGKEFGQGAPYRYHLKTHTGEKSCSCPICGKEFISKGNMRIHLKSCNIHVGLADLQAMQSISTDNEEHKKIP